MAGMIGNADHEVNTDIIKMFAMYADGDQLADIATEFGCSPPTISKRLKEFPVKLDDAKKQRAEFRNAKYRRIGALAVDLQIESLENGQRILAAEPEFIKELEDLQMEAIEGDYDDKLESETKEFKIDADLKIQILKTHHRIIWLKEMINQAGQVRGNLKTLSAVGDTAERRADLNEGKPTERTEITETLSMEEMEQRMKAAKEAGNGIDS